MTLTPYTIVTCLTLAGAAGFEVPQTDVIAPDATVAMFPGGEGTAPIPDPKGVSPDPAPEAPKPATTPAVTTPPSAVRPAQDAAPAPKTRPAAKPAKKAKKKAEAEKTEAAPSHPDHVTEAAAPIVELVQRFYEDTRDFTASFEQTYTYKAFNRKTKSKGSVSFRKPAMMRWDYSAPREKAFIVDGKDLWIWTPEDHAAIRRRGFTSDQLSTSITFLWGKGKLSDEFAIRLEGADTLVLTPRSPQTGYQEVRFRVDPKTGRVIESTVVDPQGNTNHMVFENVKLNTGIDASRFDFTPPADADVQEMTGTGLR